MAKTSKKRISSRSKKPTARASTTKVKAAAAKTRAKKTKAKLGKATARSIARAAQVPIGTCTIYVAGQAVTGHGYTEEGCAAWAKTGDGRYKWVPDNS